MPDEQPTDVPRSTISTAAAIDVVGTLFNTQRRIDMAIRLCALALVLLFLGVVGSIYLGVHTSGRVTKVTRVVSRSPCSGLTSRECVRKLLGAATVKDLDHGGARPPVRPAPRRPRRTTSAPGTPARAPTTPASRPLDTPPRSPPVARPHLPPRRPPQPAPSGPPAPAPAPSPPPRPPVDVPAPTVTTPAGTVTVPSVCIPRVGGIGC